MAQGAHHAHIHTHRDVGCSCPEARLVVALLGTEPGSSPLVIAAGALHRGGDGAGAGKDPGEFPSPQPISQAGPSLQTQGPMAVGVYRGGADELTTWGTEEEEGMGAR